MHNSLDYLHINLSASMSGKKINECLLKNNFNYPNIFNIPINSTLMRKQLHSNLKINYTTNVKPKYNFNCILTIGT